MKKYNLSTSTNLVISKLKELRTKSEIKNLYKLSVEEAIKEFKKIRNNFKFINDWRLFS